MTRRQGARRPAAPAGAENPISGTAEPPDEAHAPPPALIDVMPDELSLARAQLDAGLAALAEGTAARRIAQLEGRGHPSDDEMDGARLLLAESLWRQGRPLAARAALDAMNASSAQRRRPIAMLIEAEALAAAGEPDRAAGLLERAVAAIGVDEAWQLRAGLPSRLSWPLPAELRPEQRRVDRPPWGSDRPAAAAAGPDTADGSSRIAAARAHVEAARAAFGSGDLHHGDQELSIAVRLDPGVAGIGVALIGPTLGEQPATDRLLLYGDLLRAAGRHSDGDDAYQRASQTRT